MIIIWARNRKNNFGHLDLRKSKPQIPPTEWGSGQLSGCNEGCTEWDPAGHNCTNGTNWGWLLPRVGLCNVATATTKERKQGLPVIPQNARSSFLHTLQPKSSGCSLTHSGNRRCKARCLRTNSEASLLLESRTLTSVPRISPHSGVRVESRLVPFKNTHSKLPGVPQ